MIRKSKVERERKGERKEERKGKRKKRKERKERKKERRLTLIAISCGDGPRETGAATAPSDVITAAGSTDGSSLPKKKH